jgi:hypothetical protein
MVRIDLDEGYAYDLLSIAAVKVAKKPVEQNLRNHHRLEDQLVSQVGGLVHSRILSSEEYNALYHTNLALFNHIDDMKAREPRLSDAQLVDQYNYARYTHKRAIQERFFGTALNEQKIGYTQEAA